MTKELSMIREEFYRPPELIIPADEFVPLDSDDPLDSRMIAYYDDNRAGRFLDAAEQEMLVRGIKGGDGASVEALTEAYEGLAATVAFPLKGHGVDSEELLRIASQGVVIAAQAYGEGGGDISLFDDRAIRVIEWALNKAIPEAPRTFSDSPSGTYTGRVNRFLDTLGPSIEQEKINQEVLKDFTPLRRSVLRLLYLETREDIAKAIDPTKDWSFVNNAMMYSREQLGVHSNVSAALTLHSRGYRYPITIPDKPLVELLNDYQLTVSNFLHHFDMEIGEMVGGKTDKQISCTVSRAKGNAGARSRTELALMIAMLDTGERRNPEAVLVRKLGELATSIEVESLDYEQAQELLSEATPEEREVLDPLYLTGHEVSIKEIAHQQGVSEATARKRLQEGIKKMRVLSPSILD